MTPDARPGRKNTPGWVGYKELCEELAISRPTLERLVAQGMPRLKVGRSVRFSLPRVLEWLEAKTAKK